MVWTGYKAQLVVAIMGMVLPVLGVFPVTGYTIDRLLRTKSSKSTIKRTMKTANWWQRFTRTCFWNAKCSHITHLRFLIVLRSAAVITWPIPLIATLLAGIWGELEEIATWLIVLWSCFDAGAPAAIVFLYERMGKIWKRIEY